MALALASCDVMDKLFTSLCFRFLIFKQGLLILDGLPRGH